MNLKMKKKNKSAPLVHYIEPGVLVHPRYVLYAWTEEDLKLFLHKNTIVRSVQLARQDTLVLLSLFDDTSKRGMHFTKYFGHGRILYDAYQSKKEFFKMYQLIT